MPDENHATRNSRREVLLDQTCVVRCIPVRRRSRRVAETRKIDEVHAKRVLKQDADAAEAVPVEAPAMQEHKVPARL